MEMSIYDEYARLSLSSKVDKIRIKELKEENKKLKEEIKQLKKDEETNFQYTKMIMEDRDNRVRKYKEFEERIKQISQIYLS